MQRAALFRRDCVVAFDHIVFTAVTHRRVTRFFAELLDDRIGWSGRREITFLNRAVVVESDCVGDLLLYVD